MAHGVSETASKAEVEKASILQVLAAKEEQEIRLLHEAEEKGERQVADAQSRAVERAKKFEVELKALEKEILEKETALGQKEAAEIRARAAKELEVQVKAWRSRVTLAADKLFQRIIQSLGSK